MTNTIENKRRFMYLYEGQNTLRYQDNATDYIMNWELDKFNNEPNNKCKIDTAYLELKSLSDISDDDLLWLGRNANDYPNSNYKDDLNYCKDLVRRYLSRPPMMNYECVDYLRSRGYLLPFEDLTIEQILAYKWAVIK
jgi:hypothetical protein